MGEKSEIKGFLLLGRKVMTNLDSILKSRHHFAGKGPSSQSYGFSNSHSWMWELDHKESWVPKNWWFQTVVLKKILTSPLDSKENKPVNPKGNKPWIFIGRTDAEVPMLWPPDDRADSLEKTLMLGKIEGQRRRGWQDEMVGWHHRLNGHEFEQTLGDGEGQGAWCAAVHRVTKSRTWLSNWSTMTKKRNMCDWEWGQRVGWMKAKEPVEIPSWIFQGRKMVVTTVPDQATFPSL